ncbi:hypothetical protein [Actinomadura sp. 6K520]|uniref:hypothetical protein n=1 Tax=Actinomadura sp. 6K520 TaxID=2530364 RepID=UPI00140524D5|nr:hypothetical protein [Actinomadura sp. 6K520]
MTEHLAARDTGAAGPWHYQYRAYPPSSSFFAAPIAVVTGSIITGFFGAGFHWVLLWYLVCMALAFFLEDRVSRRVVLSPDLRMSVRGLGRDVEVDVRQIQEVRFSPVARLVGGSARVHWEGGSFRLSSRMRYLAGPADGTGLRPGRWSGDGFRDLVYRLSLANPGMIVRGVRPPSWVWEQRAAINAWSARRPPYA